MKKEVNAEMKKGITTLLLIYMLIVTACIKKQTGTNENVCGELNEITEMNKVVEDEQITEIPVRKEISEYKDCRVNVKSFIEPEKDAEIIDVGGRLLCWIPPTTVAESCELADNIIVGQVLDVTYCDENGEPRTFYSFAVTDVWKGDEIEKESIVTILEYQGYCRLSKVAESYAKQGYQWYTQYSDKEKESKYELFTYVHEPLVQPGDEYILFLGRKESWNEEYVDGEFFTLPAMYAGKYSLNADGYYEQFISYPDRQYYGIINSETDELVLSEPLMTLEEMKEAVYRAEKSHKN